MTVEANGECLNLTLNREATVALLDRPLDWRVRVVEQVLIDSPTTTLRRRSLQCDPLRPVLAAAAVDLRDGTTQRVRLALPFAPVPKGPLLDFDVTGPDGKPALLLPRAEIAERELGLLRTQAARAGLVMGDDASLVAGLALGFTDVRWREQRRDLGRYLLAGSGPGLGGVMLDRHLLGWQRLSEGAGSALRAFSERPSRDSAVENPVLVVPELLENGLVDGPEEIERVLASYLALCEGAADVAAGPDSDDLAVSARVLLNTLADYGGHYDLLAVAELPLDEPFLVKTAYRRPLGLSVLRNHARQAVVVADARSNHVALRVTDPNTRLARVGQDTADGLRVGRGRGQGLVASTASPEVHSFYGPDGDRDYRVLLSFRVAALARLQVVPYALAAGLVAVALLALREDPADRELALFVGPAALAATVLFSREPSALGSRLRVVSTGLVMLAGVFLLAVGGFLYARG